MKYNYDAWGNCTISRETTDYPLAHANPIRYRGYYYDEDTGLYYLNARYYSPVWRRFISPDDTAYIDPESVNGLNLYCYCNNDPVNCVDPSGHSVIITSLIAFGIGAVLGGLYGGLSAAANGQNVGAGIAIGFIVGGLTGFFTEVASIPFMLLGTFAVGVGGDIASQLILDKKTFGDINLISAAWAGVANAGLAVIGKGVSIVDKMADLSKAASVVFGTIMNSPIMGLGMSINVGISQYSSVYTVNDLYNDVFIKYKQITRGL